MKILKTKQEKNDEAKEVSVVGFNQIKEKMEKYGKITIEFDRDDFKKELSTCCGFGFQDMKKANRLIITEVVKNYKTKFLPQTDGGVGMVLKVKKQ